MCTCTGEGVAKGAWHKCLHRLVTSPRHPASRQCVRCRDKAAKRKARPREEVVQHAPTEELCACSPGSHPHKQAHACGDWCLPAAVLFRTILRPALRPPVRVCSCPCHPTAVCASRILLWCAPQRRAPLARPLAPRPPPEAAAFLRRAAHDVQASKPGVYDHTVPNTQFAAVYHGLKEAISTLSPIIRNRLRGLPAYVLDYSDLIPPNMVEKPFLKPVIVSGPHTGRGEGQGVGTHLAVDCPPASFFFNPVLLHVLAAGLQRGCVLLSKT